MKVNELLNESNKTFSPETKKVFSKLAKLIKTEPLKKNFTIGDSGDFGALNASEIKFVDHGTGIIVIDETEKVREIFFFDEDLKKWVHVGKWDIFTASELVKFGRKYGGDYPYYDWGWVEISPKNIKILKEENESIPRDIRRAAMHAGYDINSKELRTMTGLKVAYAKRSLETEYADQFDAKLGEVLGMIKMNKKELKDFIKNNG